MIHTTEQMIAELRALAHDKVINGNGMGSKECRTLSHSADVLAYLQEDVERLNALSSESLVAMITAGERIARLNTLLGDTYKHEDSIQTSLESWKDRAVKAEAILEALTSDDVVKRALDAHHGSFRKQENDGQEYIDLLVAMKVAIATARAGAYRSLR